MSDVGLVLVQTRYAVLATLRTPRAMLFGALFPIIFLLLFNSLFTDGGPQTTTVAGQTIDVHSYFTAGLIAYALALSCFSTPLMSLVSARERGQLKRQRGMPPPAWTFVAAQVLRSVAFALVVGGIMIAIGILFYGVDLPLKTVLDSSFISSSARPRCPRSGSPRRHSRRTRTARSPSARSPW